MGFAKILTSFIAVFVLLTAMVSCTFPARTGYDRNIGGYKPTSGADSGSQPVTSAGATKKAASNKMAATKVEKPRANTSLEALVNTWLGTPYVWGGSSKSGTDCSGFVLQIYKAQYGIDLPHKAQMMYDDKRGSSVSRGRLQEGDLVFFGSFWGIEHVGIHLSNDRFAHASSSRGVIISNLNEKYYKNKYQGARRYK